MKTSRIAVIAALVLALAAGTVWTWKLHSCPKIGIDDANIFFSYAENLASGNGLTYARNGEPVEGFTSMLWTLMCAAMFVFGLDEPGVFALTFTLFVSTQIVLIRVIRNAAVSTKGNARLLQAVYVALILSSPSYITWMTITLMDTSLWGFIVAGMTCFLVFPPDSKLTKFAAAVTFGLAPAARPEALLVAPIFIVLLWLRCVDAGREHASRVCLCLALSFLATSVGLTIFRTHYFGYPFPNTYYAKVSPSLVYNIREGIGYLSRFILSSPVIWVFFLILLCRAASWLGQRMDKAVHRSFTTFFSPPFSSAIAVSLGALTLLFVPVLTGGDHFNMFRFFQPAYPLLILAAILSLIELPTLNALFSSCTINACREHMLRTVAVASVFACCLFAFSSRPSWIHMQLYGSPIGHEFNIAETGIHDGNTLSALFANFDELPTLGVITAGGIARSYPGTIVDLMGLNNPTIAHFAGDRKGIKNHAAFEKEAFFLNEPDIMLLAPVSWSADQLKGLCTDSRFTDSWRYGRIQLSNNHSVFMSLMIKNSFLNHIKTKTNLEYYDLMYWSNKWVEATILPQREN